MSERNYYVLCDSNCKFPAMTAEQTLAAIAEATGKTAANINDAFITKLKEQNGGRSIYIWTGTRAEYNALTEIIENCLYIVEDDTTIEDMNAAIETLTARLEGNATVVNAINERIDAEVAEISGEIERVDNRVDVSEEYEELKVQPTIATAYAVGSNYSENIEVSGSLTFRRCGKVATVEVNIGCPSAYKYVILNFADMKDAPEGFIPRETQSSVVYDRANHSAQGHYAVWCDISSYSIGFTMKQDGTASSTDCQLQGSITYFL